MSELDQIITGYDVWHLTLPVVAPRDHGIGRVAGSCEVIVLRLMAEGGAEGFGEAAPWVVFTGSPEASYAALDRYFRPLVMHRRIGDRVQIMTDARRAIAHCTEAKAALETALLDLQGQIMGQPVCEILGGKSGVQIPLSVSLANPNWSSDRALLERLRQDGVRIVKLKAGVGEHRFDLMRLEELARDFPEFSVRVDFNQGLTAETAVSRVRDVAGCRPDFIEQPVAAHRYDLMGEIRGAINVPLLADESVFGPEDMARAMREGICDGVSIKVMKAGGLSRAQSVAKMAEENALSAYGGDMFESGLGHLAGAHMIAASPAITLGCEFYQARYYLAEDILEEPFPIAGGAVRVPSRPGLGVRPDVEKLMAFSRGMAGAA